MHPLIEKIDLLFYMLWLIDSMLSYKRIYLFWGEKFINIDGVFFSIFIIQKNNAVSLVIIFPGMCAHINRAMEVFCYH